MSEITQQGNPADGGPDGEQEHAPGAEPRCAACGALRPPAVTWCTQCFARFDPPAAAAPPGRAAEVPSAPEPDDVAHHPDLGPAEPRRPGAPVPSATPEEVEARAQELLARLAGEDAVEGRVRSWSGRVQGNGPKVTAMVVGTLVLTGLLIGAMALFGALL